MSIIETKFLIEKPKRTIKVPVTMHLTEGGRIEFIKAPFALKDEIKSMKGARWHQYVDGDGRKIWSVEDCYRNRFQISWMSGENPYEWFDRELIQHEYPKFGKDGFELRAHQRLMADTGLTYHYQIWGAEMGVGKTASAIAIMLHENVPGWWWVGPKSSLNGIKHEFEKWGMPKDIITDMMSYEGMMRKMREWKSGTPAPLGVIFDESQNLKTPNAQRTQAARKLADAIRDEHGTDGFVILMTGTPSPKSPGDWWSSCEIAWPGFVKEGSRDAFEKRLSFLRLRDDLTGHAFNTRIAWRDNEQRCEICGYFETEGKHFIKDGFVQDTDPKMEEHIYKPSINEVAIMSERLDGLVTIVHKKDCLDLPDKIYKEINCEPTPSLLRVAGAITKTAQNVITGLTQLRELSDGFQYREVEDGYQACDACSDGTEVRYYHPDNPEGSITDLNLLSNDFLEQLVHETIDCRSCNGTEKVVKYKRITRNVPCPKDEVVKDLLDENFHQKRIVFFAGFTGSLDRLVDLAHGEGWDTVRVDGRGWRVQRLTGELNEDSTPKTEVVKLDNPLDFWIQNPERRVAFIAHPKSGGVSLTLCEQEGRPGATMSVFYSNDYNAGSRSQAEDRIHRIGMDKVKGAMIVDLIHLPTDKRVLDVLKKNRKLELMSMGDFGEDYNE